MVRKFVVFAAALAAFAFAVQTADAHSHKKKIDPRLAATSIGVGAAATAGYFALNDWKWRWTSPNGITQAGALGLTTLGCAAVSPIVATAVLNRPLKYREAGILIGSCIVPIVGGWLVNEAYNNGTFWAPDEKPAHKHHHHHKK